MTDVGGEGGSTPVTVKETGSTSVACPMLNSTNYTVWSLRMKVFLRIHKAWSVIDPGTEKNEEKDYLAMGLLYQAIPESLIMQIGDVESSKVLWDAIKTRYIGADRVKEARLQTLSVEFDRLRMNESETIDSFSGKLFGIASKSAALGSVIDESKLVKKFLKSLPRKFIHMVASLEQILDLNSTNFDDIVGRMKAYEERIREEDSYGGEKEQALFVEHGGSTNRNWRRKGKDVDSHGIGTTGKKSHGSNMSSGSGSGSCGSMMSSESGSKAKQAQIKSNNGRSNNRPNSNSNSNNKPKKDRSKIICYWCDKPGHFASQCPDQIKKLQESNFIEYDDTDDAVFLHETVFLNEEKVIPSRYDSQENDVWYLDNGASNHMTGNRSFFSELDESITGRDKFGDNSCVKIKGKGAILFQGKKGQQRLMTEIYYIPDLKNNIISLGQATEAGCDIRMKDNFLTMHDADNCLLMKVQRTSNRLYKIKLQIGVPICLHSRLSEDAWRWHARLGHINFESMKKMSKKGLVKGLPKLDHENQLCESCLVGKQTRKSFPTMTTYKAKQPLELVHGDLCGPIMPATKGQNRYIFTLIDDFSRFMWIYLIKEKSEAFTHFKKFKALVENEIGKPLKVFRSDRGGEFTSLEFNSFCEQNGVKCNLTAPYSPQQNGIVERRNRTLMDMTRSIMKAMHVPNYLWGEAVNHSTNLINRVYTRVLGDTTPYEKLYKRKPNLENVRIFGCLAHAKVEPVNQKKLDARSRPLVHVGSEPGTKAYRLFDLVTQKIIVSRDVIFDETKGWDWIKEVGINNEEPGSFIIPWDYPREDVNNNQGNDVNNDPIESDQEIGDGADVQDNQQSSPVNNNVQQGATIQRTSRARVPPRRFQDYELDLDNLEELLLTTNGEPVSVEEAKKEPKWVKAMDAEIKSINKNNTWTLVNKPMGVKPIGLKWVFKLKKNADGTINKYKARLVAKGYVQ